MNKTLALLCVLGLASTPALAYEAAKTTTDAAKPAAEKVVKDSAAPAAAAPAAASAGASKEAAVTHTELKDGTKITIKGEEVFVVGKDGKETAAPDGNHELKDGTKVTTKGGKIVK